MVVGLGSVTAGAAPPEERAVEGRVVDAATNEALAGALVRQGETEAVTDDSGRFRIGVSSAGPPHLLVSAPGHIALGVAVEAEGSPLEIALAPDPAFQEEVVVEAPNVVAAEAPSSESVAPDRVLHTAGSADNVFRLLSTLPGVAAPEDIGSRLSVRGGGPDQNLTIMDGVEIHNPYRLFGLTSAFNPETIERFELTAGGFSARYGDRLSSLLVVENRPGRREGRLKGSATLGLTDGNVVTEGRLPGGGDGSWLLTARRTYYDLVAERFRHDDLPGFADVQLVGERGLGGGTRLRVQALHSREASDVSGTGYYQGEGADLDASTRASLVSLGLSSVLGSTVRLATTAAWSRNTDAIVLAGNIDTGWRRSNAPDDSSVSLDHVDFDRDIGVRDLSARQELIWTPSRRHLVEAGLEVHAIDSHLDFAIRGERNPIAANGSSILGGAGLPDAFDTTSRSSRFGAWLQDRVELGERLTVQAGVRLDRSGLVADTTWQPRVSATLGMPGGGRLRLAAGRYAQTPGYEKLYQSDQFLDLSRARELRIRNEGALHALVGYEQPLGAGITSRVEAFYRRFDGLVVGRLETEAETAARLGEYDFPAELASSLPADPVVTTVPTNGAAGRSYGIDLYVAREPGAARSRLTGWISYTYGVASRTAYGRTYAFEYDRRHAVSLVSRMLLGPKLELGATVRVSSGFPRTAPLGLHVAPVADGGDADGDGNTTELVPERDGEGRLVYEPYYGSTANFATARLPAFCRVDLRLTFRPKGRTGRLETYVDVINVLNRRNAAFLRPSLHYNPVGEEPLLEESPSGSVSLLPSAGVRFRF